MQTTITERTHIDHPVSTLDCVKQYTTSEQFQNTPEFHAGKISSNFYNWKESTSNRIILKTVLGYQLDFVQSPLQVKFPHQIRFTSEKVTVIDKEIKKLLDKKVIGKANRVENYFISNIFTRKKRDGTFRSILKKI